MHGFTHVVSLLDSPHNLHAYDEAGIAYVHVPLGPHDELAPRLEAIYGTLAKLLDDPTRSSSCTTRSSATACSACSPATCSTPASSTDGPHAISVIEKLTGRSSARVGREIVAVTLDEHIRR